MVCSAWTLRKAPYGGRRREHVGAHGGRSRASRRERRDTRMKRQPDTAGHTEGGASSFQSTGRTVAVTSRERSNGDQRDREGMSEYRQDVIISSCGVGNRSTWKNRRERSFLVCAGNCECLRAPVHGD